jgi:hypothetical protein
MHTRSLVPTTTHAFSLSALSHTCKRALALSHSLSVVSLSPVPSLSIPAVKRSVVCRCGQVTIGVHRPSASRDVTPPPNGNGSSMTDEAATNRWKSLEPMEGTNTTRFACGVWCSEYEYGYYGTNTTRFACGVWCTVYGARCMVHGVWCTVYFVGCQQHSLLIAPVQVPCF